MEYDIENIIEDDTNENELENDEYVQYNIISYPSDLTLNGIYEMWYNKTLVIPSFQRKFIWNIKQSSLLIDSFLCGLPVPPVFLYVDSNDKSIVIDGQQRIMSIIYFFDGFFGEVDHQGKKKVFKLQLPKKSPFNSKTYKELGDELVARLRYNSVLRAINVKQLSPSNNKQSAYYIFERLNTGGTPLRPQEIRNCLYEGKFLEMLKELNKNIYWKSVLGIATDDKHDKDIEFLLRIFAFTYEFENYEKPMKSFLNNVMEKYKNADASQCKEFYNEFPVIINKIINELGNKPFHIRGPLNVSTLETFCAFAMGHYKYMKPEWKKSFSELLNDPRFEELTKVATGDLNIIKNRYLLFEKYMLK